MDIDWKKLRNYIIYGMVGICAIAFMIFIGIAPAILALSFKQPWWFILYIPILGAGAGIVAYIEEEW